MNRRLIGIAILATVATATLAATLIDWDAIRREIPEDRDPVAVRIYFGGEKSAFLANPAVREIIEDDYAITLDARREGSVEMATTLDVTGIDCIWPSNEVAVELARNAGRQVQGDETIFNSPIVFYAWDDVAEAFTEAGIVTERGGFLYTDLAAIGEVLREKRRWREDFELNKVGPVRVISTDPSKSNSGNIWSAMLAYVFNGYELPRPADLPQLLPEITTYFEGLGFMSGSSGDLFSAFLNRGTGEFPIIVGYENQRIEFLIANAAMADVIRDRIRVIYPEPTIWSSHPLISLTPACRRFQEALLDPRVQDLAWRDHGFRTGLIGVENDPADLEVARLPERIDLVVPMPAAEVMTGIIEAIR